MPMFTLLCLSGSFMMASIGVFFAVQTIAMFFSED